MQRFFLLSLVTLAPLIAFGVLALAGVVAQSLSSPQPFALRLVAGACLAAIAISIASNYRRLDQSRNVIARHFAEDVLNTVRPHSILLVKGDGLAFPLIYLQKVEKAGSDTTLVVIPLLLGDWYVRQLREQHPDLVVPFDHYDPQTNNLKLFVEANQGRPTEVAGPVGDDHSLEADYWSYQQGLLVQVTPKSQNVPLERLLLENEQLLGRCHPPAPERVHWNTFEADILNVYTYAPFSVAGSCEQTGLIAEARKWYERTLAINPQFSKAHDALARLEH